MDKIYLLLAFSFLFVGSIDAQVRRKYKDKKYTNHTVVIKESKKISDIDILNTEFDIDQFEMGQVVRITTENRQLSSLDELAKANDLFPSQKKAKLSAQQKVASSSYRISSKRNIRSRKFKNKHYSFNKRKKGRRRVGNNKKTCVAF